MGRFERKFKKKLKEELPSFDEWFADNKDKLECFSSDKNEKGRSFAAVKAKRNIPWIIILCSFIAAVLCVGLCLLPLLKKEKTPLTFGDDAVYILEMSSEEIAQERNNNAVLNKFIIQRADKLLLWEDDSLVFTVFDADLETESDYYITTIQIEYNENYIFFGKESYETLSERTEIEGIEISYQSFGLDENDMYWYRLNSVEGGQRIYWEVHCFEESIEEFIQIVFED